MPAQKPVPRFNPLGGAGPRPARPRPGWSLWYGLALLLLLGVAQMYFMTGGGRTLSYSEFKALVRNGDVVDVTIGDQSLRGTLKTADPKDPKQGQAFTVNRVEDPKLVEDLEPVEVAGVDDQVGGLQPGDALVGKPARAPGHVGVRDNRDLHVDALS